MPSFEFETPGRDWRSKLQEWQTLAAFDSEPDRIKNAVRAAVERCFESIDTETGDRGSVVLVAKGEADGTRIELSVAAQVEKKPKKPKKPKKK